LQYDSGIDDAYRILIFASDENLLDLLVRHRQWLVDGTFKCSPSVFNQLFTLHVYMAGSVVQVVYSLLPNNKTQTTYQRMLTEFCKLRLFDPETIMTDFEQAIMNAFRSLHGESKKRHLTLAHNFTKYLPIFKILSLLDSVGNL